jgi:hypothetical protein
VKLRGPAGSGKTLALEMKEREERRLKDSFRHTQLGDGRPGRLGRAPTR